ncbi:MAG: hypothetical protein A2X12_03475 [Bacteroidetes bacterium GWE2_29_8]|nr:MAG: hypothetical protein A2X12_03475 [Bacteroidetes bacterium GWE2_29_8]OFY17397.1 MAG: hypothetical protein A2X02_00685 [Bacteroidetes bacterium GWF2_29_10]
METITENDSKFICDIEAPCFKTLSSEEIELIRGSKTQVLFRKGDNLSKQGTFVSYILFIINGLVKQYIEGGNTKTYNLRIIKSGEFIGLSSVFTKHTFDYSAISLTDCQAFIIEKDVITKIVKQNSTFGFNIIKRYCEQNTNLFDSINHLVYKQMNGRMANTLIYIDEIKIENENIFQLLSRKDIADFAGISTESAVKLLKNFEKDGLIMLNEKDIKILNKEALMQIRKNG